MKRCVIALIIILLFPLFVFCADNAAVNLVNNGDFEEDYQNEPTFWYSEGWRTEYGATRYYTSQDNPHSGTRYAVIENSLDNDARYTQSVTVEPGTVYKLSCWINAKVNERKAIGANISLMDSGFFGYSTPLFDTNGEWKYSELYVRTGPKQTTMIPCVRLGGFDSTVTGRAAFDDFRMEKITRLPAGANVLNISQEVAVPGGSKENKALSVVLIVFIVLAIVGMVVFFVLFLVRKPGKTGTAAAVKDTGTADTMSMQREEPRPRYTRVDWLLCGILTLVYAVTAFVNLGGFVAPHTHWKAAAKGERFYVDFGEVKNIQRIFYFFGVPNGHTQGNYFRFESSKDGQTWEDASQAYINHQRAFNWTFLPVNVNARFMRITAEIPNGELKEVGFVEAPGKRPVAIKEVVVLNKSSQTQGTPQNLFDEQDTVPERPDMMNGTPSSFDEIYHVRTAYEQLHHIQPYETTHPPMGKILIGVGMLIFGEVPFGWRFMGTLMGVLMIVIMYFFGKRMFKKSEYAFMCAFLMACDFMHFVQTRIATIDSFVVFFIILMYYFMYRYYTLDFYKESFMKSLLLLLFSGLCWGMAVSCKWIGIYGGFGLAFIFFTTVARRITDYRYYAVKLKSKKIKFDPGDRERIEFFQARFASHLTITLAWCVLVFIIIPVIIYIMSYIPFMLVPGNGHDLVAVWEQQPGMWNYHAVAMLKETHGSSSLWYQWPIMYNLFPYYTTAPDIPGDKMQLIVAMGNPAVWWGGSLAAIALLGISLSVLYNRLVKIGKEARDDVNSRFRNFLDAICEKDRTRFFILIAIASVYVIWATSPRKLTFIYHFFASVPFIIFAAVYVIRDFRESLQGKGSNVLWAGYGLILFYLALALILFIMFYPILTGIVVDRSYVKTFLHWFRNWSFYV